MKKHLWQLFNISLILSILASNTRKNDTKDKFKNLFGINLENYSSKFLAHTKKHLGHTITPTNVQNNCMKLSGFGVDITKLFLHRQMTRNTSCREKFLNSKNSFGDF